MPTTKNPYTCNAEFIVGFFKLFFHFIKGSLPGNLLEFSFFVKFSLIIHTKQRHNKTIFSIHDFSVKISFNTIKATIYRSSRITFDCYNFAIFSSYHNSTARSAKSTNGFIPFPFFLLCAKYWAWDTKTCNTSSTRNSGIFNKIPSIHTLILQNNKNHFIIKNRK